MEKLKIKVCGMRDKANIAAVEKLRPDFLGFIFVKSSPRFVGDDFDLTILKSIPQQTKTVGVFMNQPAEEVAEIVRRFQFPLVQLHGDEAPEYCQKIKSLVPGIEIIKCFSVGKSFDIKGISAFHEMVHYMLFDTAGAARGGTGATFDWSKLDAYRAHRPFFLAGGLGPEHSTALRHIRQKLPMLYAIDLNSRFETSPGIKSASLLGNFIREIRA